ncbi:DNA polymerase III subunit beta [Candidatus Daviesbacteria bacterium]|nr:DNA polymerase III subunit beta [Candidatus Daviesbacteria bacterium]
MKFTILQQDLLPVLQSVSRSVGVRSNLPILDNILLSVEGKRLKLAATNLEIGVIRFLPVEDGIDGEITVPAKTLLELISGLGQSQITIESAQEVLTIQSGKLKASINGISASEFPAIPLSNDKGVSFAKEVFSSSAQILFAAAVDEGRPVLTGVLTDVTDSKLDFVATDGFRLAHRQLSLPKGTTKFKSLVPKRTFEEILRIISEIDVDEISIATSENQNQIIFTLGQTVVSSRLIEGTFPAWEKIIPQTIVGRALIDKEQLLKAVKLAAIFAKNEANIVVLNTQKGVLSLKSAAKELGSQENEIEGEIEGEQLQIAFNTKFLQDAVSNIPTSQIMIEFSGPLSASLIKPIGEEGLEYIVMPVRLS